MTPTGPVLPFARRLGYGVGDFGFNLFFTTASLYLLFYYTDVLGLSPSTAGWVFAAALIWDAIFDPVMGYVANPRAPAYAASKAGVVNLTRALAARWAPDGIRVNAVAPGYVETAMTEAVRQDNALADALLQRQKLGRWGRPEEIAELIVWLLSEKASFVTGSTHLADGGFLTT